jgi:hypothetical protein
LATDTNKVTKLYEVETFLEQLRTKLKFQDVFFDRRSKNLDSYAMLSEWGYTSNDLIKIIKELKPENYFEGPEADTDNQPSKGDLWVFGKILKPINKKRRKEQTEFYIKLQIGWPNNLVICISFHPAEHEMKYPLATV